MSLSGRQVLPARRFRISASPSLPSAAGRDRCSRLVAALPVAAADSLPVALRAMFSFGSRCEGLAYPGDFSSKSRSNALTLLVLPSSAPCRIQRTKIPNASDPSDPATCVSVSADDDSCQPAGPSWHTATPKSPSVYLRISFRTEREDDMRHHVRQLNAIPRPFFSTMFDWTQLAATPFVAVRNRQFLITAQMHKHKKLMYSIAKF